MKAAYEILKNRKVSTADLKKFDEWQSAQLKRFQTALHQDDPLRSLVDAFTAEQAIPVNKDLKPDERWWSAPFFSGWAKSQAALEGIFKMSLIPKAGNRKVLILRTTREQPPH